MRGTLRVTIRDAISREMRKRITIRNKIMYLASDVLVELLAQRATDPAAVDDMLYSMRIGTSNTVPSRSDTNLGAYAIGIQLTDVNKVTGVQGELQLLATLGNADANGLTLQEAGLFTRGSAASPNPVGVSVTSDAPGTAPGTPRMFARQIFPGVAKTAAITVEFDWRIAFTA